MKVKELIELLKTYPEDAEVECVPSSCCGCPSHEVESGSVEYDKERNVVDIDS